MGKDTIIVIFGCRHQEESLGRINTAMIWAIKKQIQPIFIFTGIDPMPFPSNKITKLLGNSRIIWENESTDTESNIKNTLEIIGVRILHWYDIFIVSSWYHIPKIKLFLKRRGVNIPKQNFIRSYEDIQLINVLVEPFAFLAAFFKINGHPFVIKVKRRLGYNI